MVWEKEKKKNRETVRVLLDELVQEPRTVHELVEQHALRGLACMASYV